MKKGLKIMRSKINVFASLVLLMSILLTGVSFGFPDEGMFTPDQIGKLPLLKKGLKIKPSDIYNPSGTSLADAIMRVNMGDAGGFGTGEFISPDGLILTNHHVGFDALVAASTKEKDYATNGFKANSRAEELEAKDYNLLLTQRVEDVTAKIWAGTSNLTGDARDQALKKNLDDLQKAEQAESAEGSDRSHPIGQQRLFLLSLSDDVDSGRARRLRAAEEYRLFRRRPGQF